MTSLAEIEEKALAVLDEETRTYYQMAFPTTFQETLKAYTRYMIKPRVMRDVSIRNLSTTILGSRITFPVCIAPSAYHNLAHKDGECATAKGAEMAGVVYTMSLWASASQKQVAESVPGCLRFFAIQFLTDRSVMLEVIRRAEQLGFRALVLTVDDGVHGHHKQRTGAMDIKKKKNIHPVFTDIKETVDDNGIKVSYVHANGKLIKDPKATWDSVRWLVKNTTLPVIAKGILSGEDAELALDAGVAAIQVSNHGGRQLGDIVSTLDALSEVVRAARGRCEVYMDGGIRTGSDVYKALALGARAVFIGRPVLYGLACEGSEGVNKVLDILRYDLDTTMAKTGCQNIGDIGPDRLVRRAI